MRKILANGYIYKVKEEEDVILVHNRLRLMVNTDYTNITESFLQKVKSKLIELGYTSDWLSITKNGFLEETSINEWNQLDYKVANNSGGGSIPLETLIEIEILK